MNKSDERIAVLQENNTAQSDFNAILQLKSKKTNEISIQNSLYGALDLNLLAKMGFRKIYYLFFSEGKITNISNIPDGIKRFICTDNLLESIDHLPDTIEEIDVNQNMINSIDLSRFTKLKILRISHNNLKELNGFPESIEELYCSHNSIQKLNLKNTLNMKVLHCQGNNGLVLENVPDTLVDTNFPETVQIDHKTNISKTSKEYDDYVKEYFIIKAKYDISLKDLRKKRKDKNKPVFPKCPGCGKKEGVIFSSKNEKYSAICNASTPCDWKILIHRGFYNNEDEALYTFMEEIEEYKQNIIQQKLDTIFEYIPEKQSSMLFKTQLKAYKDSSEQLQILLQNYDDRYFNESKEESIQEKQKLIQEKLLLVKDALTNNDVELAVQIQHEEIAPLSKAIQLEKYEVQKILSKRHNNGVISEVDTSDDTEKIHYLSQEQVHMKKLEINIGESPSVEYFGKKK